MDNFYSLGIDFGTNSVRALLVDLMSGEEISSETSPYHSGENGIILDNSQPHLARQFPGDYLESLQEAVRKTIESATDKGHPVKDLKGIGIDGTGSSPLPVDATMQPLTFQKTFRNNLNAYTWLWKDHTAAEEAHLITETAKQIRPHYLEKCGGAYSSEWFFAKIYHCLNTDPQVFQAAHSWIELSDYIPAVLCGINDPQMVKRNICAAGHKAMYSDNWGGLPDEEFWRQLSPALADLRKNLYETATTSDQIAGYLNIEWAEKLGLREGTPVGLGALDAHYGGIGAGVGKEILVKIIGTSTCDIMVYPDDGTLEDIPGVAGLVKGSVLPGYIGIEAGQSAVGDLFNWLVSRFLRQDETYHTVLTEKASQLKAGESGLLALDWNNGNRNILTDPKLSGLLVGQTLLTSDDEIYRALIEATAFGARRIIEQMEKYGVKITKVINCGGIAEKNPLVMQIYADIIGRPMAVAQSPQTVALGAAIMGGAAAAKKEVGFETVESIQKRVCHIKDRVYYPDSTAQKNYHRLYQLYLSLHDGFGVKNNQINMYSIMKELMEIKKAV